MNTTTEQFRAKAHAWFADGRIVREAMGMVHGAPFPLPSPEDRDKIHRYIAERYGLSVEEVAALAKLLSS
jgi:hypothetical protein